MELAGIVAQEHAQTCTVPEFVVDAPADVEAGGAVVERAVEIGIVPTLKAEVRLERTVEEREARPCGQREHAENAADRARLGAGGFAALARELGKLGFAKQGERETVPERPAIAAKDRQ